MCRGATPAGQSGAAGSDLDMARRGRDSRRNGRPAPRMSSVVPVVAGSRTPEPTQNVRKACSNLNQLTRYADTERHRPDKLPETLRELRALADQVSEVSEEIRLLAGRTWRRVQPSARLRQPRPPSSTAPRTTSRRAGPWPARSGRMPSQWGIAIVRRRARLRQLELTLVPCLARNRPVSISTQCSVRLVLTAQREQRLPPHETLWPQSKTPHRHAVTGLYHSDGGWRMAVTTVVRALLSAHRLRRDGETLEGRQMRQYRAIRMAATCLMAVGLLIFGFGTATAQPEDSPDPPASASGATPDLETIDEIDLSSGHFAPAPAAITPQATSGVITAGDCRYQQAVDNAHVTRGEASVHGWWLSWSAGCPSTATTLVHLQAYWCDQFGCRWITVDSDSRSAGPGTGKRANARWACASTTQTVGWRGAVDVDLDWQVDPSGLTYSPPQNWSCTPS